VTPSARARERSERVRRLEGARRQARGEATPKATGELVERSTYQAYGGSESDYRPERWKSFREDYRFTGKEEDVEAGLIYFGKRFLNPLLNRWVSADPLAIHGLGADPNLYAYVSGRVLKSVDPLGLCDDDGSGGCGAGPSTQDGTPTEGASGTGNTEDLGIDRGLLGRAVGGTVVAIAEFAGVVAMGLLSGLVIPGDSGQPGQAYPEEQVAIVMMMTGLGGAVKPLSRPLISEGTKAARIARSAPRPLTKAEANKVVARDLDKVAAEVDRAVEVLTTEGSATPRGAQNSGDVGFGARTNDGPYTHMPERGNPKPGGTYHYSKRQAILAENAKRNGGVIKHDVTGKELKKGTRRTKGSKVDPNEAQVDHGEARHLGGRPTYRNARVIGAAENNALNKKTQIRNPATPNGQNNNNSTGGP